jgi:pyruvate dehydrogenase E2 component (dihydrolipoamide acetyltransferase)
LQTNIMKVPNIGGSADKVVIEIGVNIDDYITENDTIITLESDKASLDIPASASGKVVNIFVKEGDIVSNNTKILELEKSESQNSTGQEWTATDNNSAELQETLGGGASFEEIETDEPRTPDLKISSEKVPKRTDHNSNNVGQKSDWTDGRKLHASPGVRKLARELGVPLGEVNGTGRKGRIKKEDVKQFIKNLVKHRNGPQGFEIPSIPEVDFSKYGKTEEKKLSRKMIIGAKQLHRSWLNVPHVTQFDEAIVTSLEDFRNKMNRANHTEHITLVPFIIKVVAMALKEHPQFNASLNPSGEKLILKHYVNIGVAVATGDGLVVPVIRNADTKTLISLATEFSELITKAKENKLSSDEIAGASFTISSLGSIGGTAFTPIVNSPEIAILGVSQTITKQVWDGDDFTKQLILPLSLSYDHRAVNGADAVKFTSLLCRYLSDLRNLLL